MSEEIDTRVTSSLHPGNVRHIEGWDTDTAPYLGQVETAFSEAYVGLGQVHTAREKARTNPTWNEAEQVLQTADLADKIFTRVARQFDSAGANLTKSITALEEQLTAPITTKAGDPISAEIRRHVAGLDRADRLSFIQKAVGSGDEVTSAAVLGAPSYLSGLEPQTIDALTRLYHERRSPAVAKRVKTMKAALDLVSNRGGLVFAEMEKAVGMRPDRVQALRQAKTSAEQAFILRDA